MRLSATVALLLAACLCAPRLCSAASAEDVAVFKEQYGSLPGCQNADWSTFIDSLTAICGEWEVEALAGSGKPCPASCALTYTAIGKECSREVAVELSKLSAGGTSEVVMRQSSDLVYDACASGTALAFEVNEAESLNITQPSPPALMLISRRLLRPLAQYWTSTPCRQVLAALPTQLAPRAWTAWDGTAWWISSPRWKPTRQTSLQLNLQPQNSGSKWARCTTSVHAWPAPPTLLAPHRPPRLC